jgi:hypothetical protein
VQLAYQTNVPLAPGAQYVGAWQDMGSAPSARSSSAGQYVRITAYSDQPGSLVLYQADSPTGLLAANLIVDQITTSGGNLGKIEAVITAEFWQAIFTNGPTVQAVFQHYAWTSPDLNLAILREWSRVNQQILAKRGPYDSTFGEG